MTTPCGQLSTHSTAPCCPADQAHVHLALPPVPPNGYFKQPVWCGGCVHKTDKIRKAFKQELMRANVIHPVTCCTPQGVMLARLCPGCAPHKGPLASGLRLQDCIRLNAPGGAPVELDMSLGKVRNSVTTLPVTIAFVPTNTRCWYCCA